MIPILVNTYAKPILIIGGGHVALRKAKSFLIEKANITILSPDILPELRALDVRWIKKCFSLEDLDGYFLVYAATNDPDLNHTIVKNANQRQMLCGSATKEEEASFYSMTTRSNDDFILALSSKARFPYLKPVADQIMEVLSGQHERMTRLYDLRPSLIKQVDTKQSYFDLLYQSPLWLMDALFEILMAKQGHLYIYHHNDPDLMQDLAKVKLEKPYLILSLKQLETYHPLLNLDDIQWTVHPLVLYEGVISHKIIEWTPFKKVQHLKPLLADEESLKTVIAFYRRNPTHRYYIIHQRTNLTLKKRFEALLEEDETLMTLLDPISSIQKDGVVIPFLATRGNHYADIKKDVSLLNDQGRHIQIEKTLLAIPELLDYLVKHQLTNQDPQ